MFEYIQACKKKKKNLMAVSAHDLDKGASDIITSYYNVALQ